MVRAVLERGDDLLVGDLLALEVALHQRLGVLGDLVHELLAVLLRELGEIVGDRDLLAVVLAGAVVGERLHVDEVDQPADVVLGADRDLRRDHVRPEGGLQRVQRAEEVGPLAVEHVHVDQPRHAELLRALPQALRADLDAHDRVDDEHGRLAHAQRAEGVGDEGRLARGVDQVDLGVVPVERGQRRGDRHPARLLVVVGVRDRRTVSHRAEPRRRAGLEQQGLVQRRLPAPPVAHQRHVADPVCRMGHARHLALLCLPLPQGGDGSAESYRRLSPWRRLFSRSTAFVCSWEMRDSVTPRTSPISRRVRFS